MISYDIWNTYNDNIYFILIIFEYIGVNAFNFSHSR